MSDPFNSVYVTTTVTNSKANIEASTPLTIQKIQQKSKESLPNVNSFGFEASRYGLGKPIRIVIKGKITRE